MKLEEKIAKLRKKNGWSQEELAFRVDVSRQAVSKWEMGASVPDLDKVIKMSEVFGVTTDYLLKETCDTEVAEESAVKNVKTPRRVSDEEGEEYLSCLRKQSWKIAIGVAVCILSPIGMFLLIALSAKGYPISEALAGGLGTGLILLFCAVGVIFLIVGGMALSRYDYLEKEEISVSVELERSLRERRNAENRGFVTAIAIGVALCIVSAVPLLVSAAFGDREWLRILALAALFPIAASGVFLFVKFGMIRGGYAKLLQEDEYTVEKKRETKRTSVFAGVYWCLVTALYLGLSFWTNRWEKTWIVWPVAGVLFAALNQLVAAIAKKKK